MRLEPQFSSTGLRRGSRYQFADSWLSRRGYASRGTEMAWPGARLSPSHVDFCAGGAGAGSQRCSGSTACLILVYRSRWRVNPPPGEWGDRSGNSQKTFRVERPTTSHRPAVGPTSVSPRRPCRHVANANLVAASDNQMKAMWGRHTGSSEIQHPAG